MVADITTLEQMEGVQLAQVSDRWFERQRLNNSGQAGLCICSKCEACVMRPEAKHNRSVTESSLHAACPTCQAAALASAGRCQHNRLNIRQQACSAQQGSSAVDADTQIQDDCPALVSVCHLGQTNQGPAFCKTQWQLCVTRLGNLCWWTISTFVCCRKGRGGVLAHAFWARWRRRLACMSPQRLMPLQQAHHACW